MCPISFIIWEIQWKQFKKPFQKSPKSANAHMDVQRLLYK